MKIFCASALLAAALAPAQAPTPPPVSDSSHSAHTAHKRKNAPQAALARDAQPAPPLPDWPINDHPAPATISWNTPELRIEASNASLQQILSDVSSATGTEVDGLGKDERVFGSFGPGPARDVIAQILQGTGYNIMMVGDQGQGVPRAIILSPRDTSKAQAPSRPAAEEPEDEAPEYPQYEPQPQPQQAQPLNPQTIRPGFPPEGTVPGRLPQQYPQQQPPQQPQQPQQPGQPAPQNQ